MIREIFRAAVEMSVERVVGSERGFNLKSHNGLNDSLFLLACQRL